MSKMITIAELEYECPNYTGFYKSHYINNFYAF